MQAFTLKQWLEEYSKGTFAATDTHTQCNAGWWDWFCRDTSLATKTRKLAPKVKRIAKSSKINTDKVYVWFKNNCPLYGDKKLYDDFRIADPETQDVIYTIVPRTPHGISEVWGKENGFSNPIVSGNWKDVLNFFGV
jgi:hypothetical protein